MSEKEIEKLLESYSTYLDNSDQDGLYTIGDTLDKSKIRSYINRSIQLDMSPDKVLSALFYSISPSHTKDTITDIIKMSILTIIKWDFVSYDQAHAFTMAARKNILSTAGNKTSLSIIDKAFSKAITLADESKADQFDKIADELFSLIPPIFKRLHEDMNEFKLKGDSQPARVHCENWLSKILEAPLPNYAIPSAIDTFTELPLTDEQLSSFVDKIFDYADFKSLPIISEHLFPPLRENPKLTNKCLLRFIKAALEVEKIDINGENVENLRAQCALIKKLFTVSLQSTTVREGLVKLLTSKTDLPSHFTPFITSLAFYQSKLSPKIRESFEKFFEEQLNDDYKRIRSRFLSHVYGFFSDQISTTQIETVFSLAIEMARNNLENNIQLFVEFAFLKIDSAQPPGNKKSSSVVYKESFSEFIDIHTRQIEICVRIINDCVQAFPLSANSIYEQIVQRLISNSPNSIYLVQCLNSPKHLFDVIEYIQYLELPVVEQLMRFAVPKICDDEDLMNRAVITAKKSFFQRTERAKLNGVAALFYLIQPRSENTFTQFVSQNKNFGERLDSAVDEDLQHDLFGLMRRGLTQNEYVQADIYFFIPFLLQQNSELSSVICSTFKEKMESICQNDDYPLEISPSVPHFLHCISRCTKVLPEEMLKEDEWSMIVQKLNELCEAVSNIDFDIYHETLQIFINPDDRETVLAIISVMFNHTVLVDKDIALSLFTIYDRINHKKKEIEKVRKDNTLVSSLIFPHFMDVTLLKGVFKLLECENGDYVGNYGIQLYVLKKAKAMIDELNELRLEMRSERLKIVLKLGKLLFNAFDRVKWSEAPAGYKENDSLIDLLTTSFRDLFSFVFSTYKINVVEKFLQKTNLVAPDKHIQDAHLNLLRQIKVFVRNDQMKSASNFISIAEQIALIGHIEKKYYDTIDKLLTSQILKNSVHAGKIVHLARYYAPRTDFTWLIEKTQLLVGKLTDESARTSPALGEIISSLSVYLEDVMWMTTVWIPMINASNPDSSRVFVQKLSVYLSQLESITEELMKIDYTIFSASYYQSLFKFICKYYKLINILLKTVQANQHMANDGLSDLIRDITKNFDDKASQFSLKNQIKNEHHHKDAAKQDKFDSIYAPKLRFLIEKVRATVTIMIDKCVIDADISESFCKIRGTDVKLPASARHKKKKGSHKKGETIEDYPAETPAEPEQDDEADAEQDQDDQEENDEE